MKSESGCLQSKKNGRNLCHAFIVWFLCCDFKEAIRSFQLYNDPFDGFIKAEQRLVAAGDGDKHVLISKLITEL